MTAKVAREEQARLRRLLRKAHERKTYLEQLIQETRRQLACLAPIAFPGAAPDTERGVRVQV